jgi:hypothetical protein
MFFAGKCEHGGISSTATREAGVEHQSNCRFEGTAIRLRFAARMRSGVTGRQLKRNAGRCSRLQNRVRGPPSARSSRAEISVRVAGGGRHFRARAIVRRPLHRLAPALEGQRLARSVDSRTKSRPTPFAPRATGALAEWLSADSKSSTRVEFGRGPDFNQADRCPSTRQRGPEKVRKQTARPMENRAAVRWREPGRPNLRLRAGRRSRARANAYPLADQQGAGPGRERLRLPLDGGHGRFLCAPARGASGDRWPDIAAARGFEV